MNIETLPMFACGPVFSGSFMALILAVLFGPIALAAVNFAMTCVKCRTPLSFGVNLGILTAYGITLALALLTPASNVLPIYTFGAAPFLICAQFIYLLRRHRGKVSSSIFA